jgi:hypothetical protein
MRFAAAAVFSLAKSPFHCLLLVALLVFFLLPASTIAAPAPKLRQMLIVKRMDRIDNGGGAFDILAGIGLGK